MNVNLVLQTITISGISAGPNSGSYSILVQNIIDADTIYCASLTATSSGYDITNAMSCALSYVNPIYIECNYFSVVPTLTTVTAADGSQSRTLALQVSFLKDNVFPFTLLSVDTTGLIRKTMLLSFGSIASYLFFHILYYSCVDGNNGYCRSNPNAFYFSFRRFCSRVH